MRVTIVTVGSRGDVQPYVALGLGLKAAGHHVRLATHAIFEDFVRAYGLDFAPIPGDPRENLKTEAGKEFLNAGSNPLKTLRALRKTMQRIDPPSLSLTWKACEDADAVIYSILGFSGFHTAEKLGIPSFAGLLQPFSRTREFPMIGGWSLPGSPGWYNLLTYVAGEHIFWNSFRPIVNRWREEYLDLPPLSRKASAWSLHQPGHPILYGYSPSVVPRPRDWSDEIHVTGYWFLDAPPGWVPPTDLVDFLESGPQPVYVGFGSMTNQNPDQVAETVTEALALSKQRGILLTGWDGMSGVDSTDDVFVIESVPHDWLFPKMAAVVHHGGAGTTGAGLRAGVPSVLVPFSADQFFWGDRVRSLGGGPKFVPRKRLDARRLASAIQTAVSDDGIRAKADALGKRIRSERGVFRAIEAFNMHANKTYRGTA